MSAEYLCSLDPDQAGQDVWPDSDPKCLIVFLNESFKKVQFEKKISRKQKTCKKHAELPSIGKKNYMYLHLIHIWATSPQNLSSGFPTK